MSLFSTLGFLSQERISESNLKNAFKESQKRHTITHQDRQLLDCSVRRDLGSVNRHARIVWAEAVCREFQDFFDLDKDHPFPDQPLFFVTLTDLGCVTAHDATFVDIPKFKRILRKGLGGLSYVGMVEPGYYVNIAAGTQLSTKRAISWHVHAICWGKDSAEMKRRFRRLNRAKTYRPIIDGLIGAHCKKIADAYLAEGKRTFLADKLRYMLKSPQKAYRICKTSRVTAAGEIVPCFRQRKSDLRKGERIDLFHLMKGLYLDELAMGGGEGTEMLRRIKRRAQRVGPARC
jgi:hypothetical protein